MISTLDLQAIGIMSAIAEKNLVTQSFLPRVAGDVLRSEDMLLLLRRLAFSICCIKIHGPVHQDLQQRPSAPPKRFKLSIARGELAGQ